MDAEKWLYTMKVFDEYERRFAQARCNKKFRPVHLADVRDEVVKEAKDILSYKDELVPVIDGMEEVSRISYDTYDVIQLRYRTWDNFYGCATLYEPHLEGKIPLVFLFCGHGAKGRNSEAYLKMGHALASKGVAVFSPENIGQGDRIHQGHRDCIAPFYCGLTLQGLIVMESVAVVRYMSSLSRYDSEKIAACGNSGGGVLTLFMAAFAPEIKVLSSSGYPSEFSHIMLKEKNHCACNLLPGVAKGPEMWEILSTFAPKPILLEQGMYDQLFPLDIAYRNARKVENVYVQLGAKENFNFAATKEIHSWGNEDYEVIGNFLLKNLGVEWDGKIIDSVTDLDLSEKNVEIPQTSLTTSQLAECLTGIKMSEGTMLSDIFPPVFEGELLRKESVADNVCRGDTMTVLAQMESALKGFNTENK